MFTRDESKDIEVRYRRFGNTKDGESIDGDNNSTIRFICPNSDNHVFGKPLSLEFIRIVTRDGWSFDDVARFMWRYLSIVESFAKSSGTHISLESPYIGLPGEFFDAVPQNIVIRQNGSPALIDKEWQLVRPIEVAHLLFRSLLLLVYSITRFGRPQSGNV